MSNPLKIIAFSLLFWLSVNAATEAAVDFGQDIPSVYLIENGAARDVSELYLQAESNMGKLNKAIVLGYVKKPGVYLFKEKVMLIDLMKLAGVVTFSDGARSTHAVGITGKLGSRLIDIDRAKMYDAESAPPYLFVHGDEIVFRKGLLGM